MTKQIYAKLAPFPIEERVRLSIAAVNFFSLMGQAERRAILKKEPTPGKILPFSGWDFVAYLSATNQLPEAESYMQRIGELLGQLARAHILTETGGGGAMPLLGGHYYFFRQLTALEGRGILWLAPALGAEFLANVFASFTVHITGRSANGDEHGATALVIGPKWLLTCAHAVNDMTLHTSQRHDGTNLAIERIMSHPHIDVALIEIAPALSVLPGLAFRDPVWAEQVVTLGYPRVPLSRDPALLMHSGEITTPAVKTLKGENLFLYSAVARPGNSGGPVIASSGYVVGLVTEELSTEESGGSPAPFFAGLGASVIAKAIAELTQSVVLPMEDYQ